MTNRGRPLPIPLRLAIKQRIIAGCPIKFTARALGVDRNTVRKYARTVSPPAPEVRL